MQEVGPMSEGSHHLLLLYMQVASYPGFSSYPDSSPFLSGEPWHETIYRCKFKTRKTTWNIAYNYRAWNICMWYGYMDTKQNIKIFKPFSLKDLCTVQTVSLHIQNFLCTCEHCTMNTYSALVVRLRSGVLPTIAILRE